MKNIENSLVALIDRKINNEMVEGELKQFDKLVNSDPSVAEDLHLQTEIEAAIGETDVIDMRKTKSSLLPLRSCPAPFPP